MEIASIINEYYDAFSSRYGDTVLPSQMKALDAMRHCRTPAAGELYVRCSDCDHAEWRPLSCGNRNCPQCQNHESSQWIDRQQNKLLPVQYFMVTFTLPCEFRAMAYRYQKIVYSILFSCVAGILKDFGLNPRHLGAEIGMTMVLHTQQETGFSSAYPCGSPWWRRRQTQTPVEKEKGEISVQSESPGKGLSCPIP